MRMKMADRVVVKRHNYKFEHISNIEKVNQSKILLCLILSSSEVTKNCLSQFLLIFFILFLLRKISNSVIWYPIMRHRNWSRAAVLFNNNFQLAQSPTASTQTPSIQKNVRLQHFQYQTVLICFRCTKCRSRWSFSSPSTHRSWWGSYPRWIFSAVNTFAVIRQVWWKADPQSGPWIRWGSFSNTWVPSG